MFRLDFKDLNRWKFATITLVLIVALLVSCFAVLYQPSFEASAKEPFSLNVSIDGPAKIGANAPTDYAARVFGGEGALTYSWSISPDDSNVVLEPDGGVCVLTFTTATEAPYTLEVTVHDAAGNFGVASMAVYDPPTYPNYYLGVSTAPYSYMIKTDGTGWYYAVNGSDGSVSWSSTNASYMLQQASNTLGIGGEIILPSTHYYLSSGITLPENTTLRGLSTSGTIIHTTASGFAITYQGSLSVDFPSFCLSDLTIDGGSLTSGRNGLHLYQGGDNCRIERVNFCNLDVAVWADDFEGAKISNFEIHNVNYGIVGNQTSINTQNMFTLSGFRIIGALVNGIQFSQGRSVKITDGQLAECATGILVDNNLIDFSVSNINFEQDTGVDINLAGASEAFPLSNAHIFDVSFRGRSSIQQAVKIGYVNNVEIENCHFYDYPYAINFVQNTATGQSLTLINPVFSNITYQFTSISLGYSLARMCGTVITPHWSGILCRTDANVTEGQIMKYGNINGLITAAADNDKSPIVVMYPQVANGITAIATSVIVKVNNGTAVALGDTLCALNPNLCFTNNTMADPSKIIGTVWGIDDNTHVYAKIQ